MQDFTGVPAIVDLAAMRDAMEELGGDATAINPLVPVELVIDHSIQVDSFAETARVPEERGAASSSATTSATPSCAGARSAFDNFSVVPPNTGICHQVNLEYLSRVVESRDGQAFPDTLVGTDSHTTMVNGLGVLGWGVGGIEAEAAMLGQPVSMLLPQVVGFRVEDELPEGSTATDLVLTVTEMLRERGVVGKFVEFYGPGLANLALADRRHHRQHVAGVRLHLRDLPGRRRDAALHGVLRPSDGAAGAGRGLCARSRACSTTSRRWTPSYSDDLELDLSTVEPSLAGPKRPQDRVALSAAASDFLGELCRPAQREELRPRGQRRAPDVSRERPALVDGRPGRRRGRRPARTPAREGGREKIPHASSRRAARRQRVRPRGRRGRDRRDHQLHEHLEPVGDARGRPAGQEGGRDRACNASRGSRPAWRPGPRWSPTTSIARSSRSRCRSSGSTSWATAAPRASATPGRSRTRSRRASRPRTSPSARCCRATATSRAASTPR